MTHSHIAKFVPRVEFVSSCQNFLPRATHRPLPLTELNTACFRESPPADFGKVPRSVNPVILCHWHNELNTSKYHFQKQNHRQQPSGLTLWHWQCLTHLKHKYYRLQAISGQLQGVFFLDTFRTNLAVLQTKSTKGRKLQLYFSLKTSNKCSPCAG